MDTSAAQKKSDPAAALRRAGVIHPYQALMWMPKRHEDFTLRATGFDYHLHEGRKVCIRLTAAGRPTYREKGSFTIEAVDDAGGSHRLMLFGILKFSPWAGIVPGASFWIRAKVVQVNGYHYLNSAEWADEETVGAIAPVYHGKAGVLAAAVITASAQAAIASRQHLHDATLAIREAFGGMEEAEIIRLAGCHGSLQMILTHIHAPTDTAKTTWAMKASRQLAVAYIRWAAEKASERPMAMQSIIRISGDQMRRLVAGLPYAITTGEGGQADAVRAMIRLLAEPYPMDALLSADVGVGKTVCYGLVAAAAQQQGFKVAILIPNTVLVDQVVQELRAYFPTVPIAHVADGVNELPDWANNPVLIGTSKLFKMTAKVKWLPDLLVVDETQKMDEGQRNKLRAPHTNVLETTATPLPRSMAMMLHGGKQLIQVSKQHANKSITTRVIDRSHKGEMFARIKERVAMGDQAAIVYPRVAASSDDDTKSVIAAAVMWEKHFPGQIAVLHGKMEDAEKTATLRRIKSERIPIIVTSSIIEVGVTIENLRFMMVVHAERYGAFTLHQFRGRLARLGGEGEFLLYLPEDVEEETLERVRLLESTTNGFELAELDMAIRGFGDLAAADGSQSGKTSTLFRSLALMPSDFDEPTV